MLRIFGAGGIPLNRMQAERPVRIMRVEDPGRGDTCTMPVQHPVLKNQKKPVTCSRVQEPFTSGYYVTGMHTGMQVLMLRLRIFL